MGEQGSNQKKCVLVVDNEPKILDVLSLLLQTVGYDAVKAEDGNRAIELMRQSTFDAVLLDLIMPGFSGEDVLKSVRTFSQVPVILFSAMPLDPEEVAKMGANAIIPKAVEIDTLAAKIESVIAEKHIAVS